MDCAVCSTPVPDDSVYCHHCGSLVSDAEGQKAATAAMDAAAFQHVEKLLREDTAGEFEIERRLGKGGMAVVYLATEVHLGRQVAIKVLPPDLTFGHGVERFRREARTAATLVHPNIIPIFRVSSGARLFWYAMQYLEGQSLDGLIKEKKLFSVDETIKLLEQVADALDYAHERRVVHRDIKPANVMLDLRGRVVLTDFGIAKALNEGTLTASGSAIGTPYYMSPEQAMGGVPTGAADQYSLAVTAYQMLSGQVPFEGNSAVDILHKHCMNPPPPLEVLRPGLPRYVYLAVHKGLAKEPKDRFSSVKAFVEGLKQETRESVTAVVEIKKRSSFSRISTTLVTLRRTRPKWAVGLAVVAVAGAGLSISLWLKGASQAPPGPDPRYQGYLAAGGRDSTGRNLSVMAPPPADTVRADSTSRGATQKKATPAPKPPVVRPPAQRQLAVIAPPTPKAVPTGVLVVSTTGGWAHVSVDGTPKSESPYRDSLPAGAHRVTLARDGYVTIDTAVSVTAGETFVLKIPMQKAPQ